MGKGFVLEVYIGDYWLVFKDILENYVVELWVFFVGYGLINVWNEIVLYDVIFLIGNINLVCNNFGLDLFL